MLADAPTHKHFGPDGVLYYPRPKTFKSTLFQPGTTVPKHDNRKLWAGDLNVIEFPGDKKPRITECPRRPVLIKARANPDDVTSRGCVFAKVEKSGSKAPVIWLLS